MDERQELEDEYNARYGDPRHCEFHPMVQTSSGCGNFDAPCGLCESEMDEYDTVDPEWVPEPWVAPGLIFFREEDEAEDLPF